VKIEIGNMVFVVLVGDCSLLVIPHIRLGLARFQHYLLSFEFKFISFRPTQIGHTQVITKAYPTKYVQHLCLRHHTKHDHGS